MMGEWKGRVKHIVNELYNGAILDTLAALWSTHIYTRGSWQTDASLTGLALSTESFQVSRMSDAHPPRSRRLMFRAVGRGLRVWR